MPRKKGDIPLTPPEHRDEAASHLTPADLARAQERAREWFEEHQVKPQ
jgi:hypothetical protein